MNRAIENPTRNAKARTVRFDLPLSFMRNTSADPRLVRMRIKAIATTILMREISRNRPQKESRVCHSD